MVDKYIDLLLHKCSRIDRSHSLLIHYSVEIKDFIDKIVSRVRMLGVNDIYLDSFDIYEEHDYLLHHTMEEIETSKYFDKSIWDEYAKKDACFLIFETEYPHVMDDVPSDKIGLSAKIKRESRLLYRKKVEKCELSWCIAAYPGKVWANSIFEGEDSYQKLMDAIFRMCMVNVDNPNEKWEKFLDRQGKIQEYLNQLGLEKLHYYNSLGTDLEIYLPDGYLFSSALDNDVIVNMPSYEVFASPIYNKTKGIVYSSRPLMYQGALIDKFWIRFDEGRVVSYDAELGRDVLKSIIDSDSNSCYLGECAFVEVTSPIAKEGIIYKTTLIDENASCHLALGAGFGECIRDGLQFSDEELLKHGINVSKNHVDFMIGTDDMMIDGIRKDGSVVSIFKNGKFSQDIVSDGYDVL